MPILIPSNCAIITLDNASPGATNSYPPWQQEPRRSLIVEVTPSASPSTIALAAAARHTGGRLVCILPEPVLDECKKAIKDSGFKDIVEFKTGDPSKLLPDIENIDFSLVDCKNEEYRRFLPLLGVNFRKSVVVANNLVGGKKGLGGHVRGMKEKAAVRSIRRPIGKGMEITMIGKYSEIEKRGGSAMRKVASKSKWIVKVDEKSGEKHIYRVLNHPN